MSILFMCVDYSLLNNDILHKKIYVGKDIIGKPNSEIKVIGFIFPPGLILYFSYYSQHRQYYLIYGKVKNSAFSPSQVHSFNGRIEASAVNLFSCNGAEHIIYLPVTDNL